MNDFAPLLRQLQRQNDPLAISAAEAIRSLVKVRDEMCTKLAELERQEPVFWYRPCCDGEMYEGPIHSAQIERVRRLSGAWVPLFAIPIQAEPLKINDRPAEIEDGKPQEN